MIEKAILKGVRILDFSWVLAGPYATRLLADFGAEVIKVQPVGPQASDRFSRGYYNTWNRNKLGITLNLSKPDGIEIAKRLVKVSDAAVENFSPRVMTNWGLDYAELVKLKPDIIMLSLSAMGHSGPWRDYSGFGPTVQAFSGLTHLTAYPGEAPLGMGYSYADQVSGLYGSLAVLGALEYRRQTGKGQYIDLSELEAMTSLLADPILEYTRSGVEPCPVGNSSERAAPYGVYRCSGNDRWCAITVETSQQWEGFKKALGLPAWTAEKRFSNVQGRLQNGEVLDKLVEEWTVRQPAEEVMKILQAEGVAAGVVQNATDLASDPQLKARGFFVEMDHPELRKTVMDASPIRLSETPAEYRQAAPAAGRDNDYVYSELLGLSPETIKNLRGHGII